MNKRRRFPLAAAPFILWTAVFVAVPLIYILCMSFMRRADTEKPVMWVFNFTPVVREGYRVPCPDGGVWKEVLNTDSAYYGGSNVGNPLPVHASHSDWGAHPSLALTLPPLAAVALMPED